MTTGLGVGTRSCLWAHEDWGPPWHTNYEAGNSWIILDHSRRCFYTGLADSLGLLLEALCRGPAVSGAQHGQVLLLHGGDAVPAAAGDQRHAAGGPGLPEGRGPGHREEYCVEKWHRSLRLLGEAPSARVHPVPFLQYHQPRGDPQRGDSSGGRSGAIYLQSVTVTATNSDTANDIINKALPMLGITGSEKYYQLWVSSGKKEAPFPLIGHEQPYKIHMSLLQTTGLLPENSISPTLQEPIQEQPSLDMQGGSS
ncbi:uncharacterized protein LOC103268869 [Carlito syrichta]|uniref:Uncharacterized protein LOC103268869 n=1 Tax=Carlito syrichta TaxID=1868482 RepID=A0A3Q0E8J4_CARSF|nr:uncharacterized protein LOC103268869 [Carlito syrichta]